MHEPISNWNLTRNKFLFQERSNSPIVFMVELFMDKPPKLFKFKFSESVTAGQINSVFRDGEIVIPAEESKSGNSAAADTSFVRTDLDLNNCSMDLQLQINNYGDQSKENDNGAIPVSANRT